MTSGPISDGSRLGRWNTSDRKSPGHQTWKSEGRKTRVLQSFFFFFSDTFFSSTLRSQKDQKCSCAINTPNPDVSSREIGASKSSRLHLHRAKAAENSIQPERKMKRLARQRAAKATANNPVACRVNTKVLRGFNIYKRRTWAWLKALWAPFKDRFYPKMLVIKQPWLKRLMCFCHGTAQMRRCVACSGI